jgi:DNA-binding transcriptional ArsR family regulator
MQTIERKRTNRRRGAIYDAMTVSGEQMHAIGHPTRWRILGRLQVGPASIQELATGLGRAKGTIGHHVRVLERAGLIRLAETKRVRGVVEKRYLRVARQFRLPGTEEEGTADPQTAMVPIRSALAEARPGTGAKGDPTMAFVVRARMPAARAKRFSALMEQLATEFVEGAPGTGETFGFTGAVYVPDWSDGTDAGADEPPPNKERA